MAPTLKEAQVISDIAAVLCELLPGSGYRQWPGHVSFESIAKKLRLQQFWVGGSKLSSVTALLSQTLERRPTDFEELIVEVVRAGLTYRTKNNRPVTRDEVLRLNQLLLRIGKKPTRLWDPEFLNLLGEAPLAANPVPEPVIDAQSESLQFSSKLAVARERFDELSRWSDRQAAGIELEKLLNELFTLNGLKARMPYKLKGEQIDGAFELDGVDYLVEAKWKSEKIGQDVLYVFHGKIARKSSYSRGVLFAPNGITQGAQEAYRRGDAANFFVVDGYDIWCVLQDLLRLPDLLRGKRTKLAQEGVVFVSARELL